MKKLFYILMVMALAACSEEKKAEVLTMPDGSIPKLPGTDTTAVATTQGGKGRINPAHGEPGHTCAVPVGAMIPSAPAANQTTTLTPQQQIEKALAAQSANNTQTVTSVQPAAPAIDPNNSAPNPEHGKPGHRCDIAVGAPLNSKSTTPAAPAVVQTPQKTTTAKGMNPPHGEPGHRCDIAVGAPLNGKPAAQPAPVVAKAPAPVAPEAPVKIEQANGGVRNN